MQKITRTIAATVIASSLIIPTAVGRDFSSDSRGLSFGSSNAEDALGKHLKQKCEELFETRGYIITEAAVEKAEAFLRRTIASEFPIEGGFYAKYEVRTQRGDHCGCGTTPQPHRCGH